MPSKFGSVKSEIYFCFLHLPAGFCGDVYVDLQDPHRNGCCTSALSSLEASMSCIWAIMGVDGFHGKHFHVRKGSMPFFNIRCPFLSIYQHSMPQIHQLNPTERFNLPPLKPLLPTVDHRSVADGVQALARHPSGPGPTQDVLLEDHRTRGILPGHSREHQTWPKLEPPSSNSTLLQGSVQSFL